MTECPICGVKALPEDKQPQAGLHGFSTKFECGTQIAQAFSSYEYDYEKRCDNLSNKTAFEKLMYPDELIVVYSDSDMKPVPSPMTVFLAGPTPSDPNTPSWRPQAIEYLRSINFKGYVFVPERENGWSDNFEYDEQIEWEESALATSRCILFWIPRELEKMPAFTTNIEWGYWTAKKPSKLVLGAPKDAPKMDYLRYYAEKLNIPNKTTLNEALDSVVEKLEYEAKRHI